MERTFKGIGISPGIAIARALVLKTKKTDIPFYTIRKEKIRAEIQRFHNAIEKSKGQLLELKKKIRKKVGKEHAYIFDAHLYMLKDGMLLKQTEDLISRQRINAEWAVEQVISNIMSTFAEFTDDYFKERMSDIADVGGRIEKNLMGDKFGKMEKLQEQVILVSHNLLPSDTAELDWEHIVGLVTDVGGQTTHSGIIARSLSKPAVVALQGFSAIVKNGDQIIIDGNHGIIILRPGKKQMAKYRGMTGETDSMHVVFNEIKDKPATTLDGFTVLVKANIETIKEIDAAADSGAAGIGLFRSEYIYFKTRGKKPTVEEQIEVYQTASDKINPHPVTIRTFDLGADKAFCSLETGSELNPALGLRGIRFSLMDQDLFRDQLEAIFRANSHGNLRILFPLISGLEELMQCKEILSGVKKSLSKKGETYNTDIPVGVMIEVPSAAAIADILAREVDFFSIGTNDLIQYTLGIDRYNENVSYLYQPLHPALLRMMKNVVDAGHALNIPVGMCGEMAADPIFLLILLGLGLDELSMNYKSIPLVKYLIRAVEASQARTILEKALTLTTSEEIENFLLEKIKERFPSGFLGFEQK